MRNWLVLIVLLLLAVLIESSFLAWPFVLWAIWWMSEVEEKFLIAAIVVSGLVLDTLMVRTVGVSALGLLGFWVVLRFLRMSFVGMFQIEIGWLLVTSAVWNMTLGSRGGVGELLIIEVVALILMVVSRQSVSRSDIKLK